jgi:hypothetical protein
LIRTTKHEKNNSNEVISNGVTKAANGSPVKPTSEAATTEQTKTPVKEPQLDEESRDSTVQSASIDDEEELSGDDAHDEEEEQDDEADEGDDSLQEAAESNGKQTATNGESKSHKRSAEASFEGDEEDDVDETAQKKKRVEPEDAEDSSEAVASAE